MRLVIDIEANALENPTTIWCIVAKDLETGEVYSFVSEYDGFVKLCEEADEIIGHNALAYDVPALNRLLGPCVAPSKVTDTLTLSHLFDYRRPGGHSLEAWGETLGFPKIKFNQFDKYTPEMLEYCKNDVELNTKLYEYLMAPKRLGHPTFSRAIETEMAMAVICEEMHQNGFAFNQQDGNVLLLSLEKEVADLDKEILEAFPPKLKLIKVYTPKATKHGTISKTSVPRDIIDLSHLSVDSPFSYCVPVSFNPSSPRQVVDRLDTAGWSPVDLTEKGKELNKSNQPILPQHYKINERNLATLPEDAPPAARLLVKRIMLGARVRTLTEWTAHCHIKISINKESIEESGRREKDERILNGQKERSKEIDLIDFETILRSTVDPIKVSSSTIIRKNEREDTILKITTDSLSKILIEWLKSRNLVVKSVEEETKNSLSIIVMPLIKSEDFCVDSVIASLDGLRINEHRLSITYLIKSRFSGIGTWTHRLSSKNPNLQNVSAMKSIKYNSPDLKARATELGGQMRGLFLASPGWWLVGCDMESAHLRIFAHLINDEKFIKALLEGKKEDGTDPHSLNKRILGSVCADRDRAKTFIFSFLNGAGVAKVGEIFGCGKTEARSALERFVSSYPGLAKFRNETAVKDAERGYFISLDGRAVKCDSAHHMLAGYMQNYEKIIMAEANILWRKELDKHGFRYRQVNLIHDEFQTEVEGGELEARRVGEIQADALRLVGEYYKMNCPMGGSYRIGKTWLDTH